VTVTVGVFAVGSESRIERGLDTVGSESWLGVQAKASQGDLWEIKDAGVVWTSRARSPVEEV
jgi:hypothetical protein